jgi:hypothetical protein
MKRILLNPVLKSLKRNQSFALKGGFLLDLDSLLHGCIANKLANICHGLIPKQSHLTQCHISMEVLDSPTLPQALISSSKEHWVEAVEQWAALGVSVTSISNGRPVISPLYLDEPGYYMS